MEYLFFLCSQVIDPNLLIYILIPSYSSTKLKFKKRLYEHINYVNTRNLEEPSAEHFCKPGHKVHNLLAIGIEQVRNLDPFILKAREHWIIKKFDSFRNGLNQEP